MLQDYILSTFHNQLIAINFQNYLPDLQRVFLTVSRMNEVMEPLKDHIQTVITPSSICFVHNMLPLRSLLRREFLNVYVCTLIVDGYFHFLEYPYSY